MSGPKDRGQVYLRELPQTTILYWYHSPILPHYNTIPVPFWYGTNSDMIHVFVMVGFGLPWHGIQCCSDP
eukprot:scaffold5008_cov206-Amphora_coffeaeformis.AAC.1